MATTAIGTVPMDPDGVMINWHFVARIDMPQTPWMDTPLLLDSSHRDVKVRGSAMTAVTVAPVLPTGFELLPNYPNPFNPNTVIAFILPVADVRLRLEVFDMLGQRIAILADGPMAAGMHRVAWDGRDLRGRPVASGVYLSRLLTEDGVRVRSMLLLR